MADENKTEQVATPEYLTKEDFNSALNAAITQRLASFEKSLSEKLDKLIPQPKQTEQVEDKRPDKQELINMKKQLDQIKQEKEQEVSKRRDTELRNQLKEHLTKAGVAPQYIKPVLSQLLHEDKLVSYSQEEPDKLIFKSNGFEEDLEKGISKWISQEGKHFLAARGTKGSGSRSPNDKQTSSQKELSNGDIGMIVRGLYYGNQ